MQTVISGTPQVSHKKVLIGKVLDILQPKSVNIFGLALFQISPATLIVAFPGTTASFATKEIREQNPDLWPLGIDSIYNICVADDFKMPKLGDLVDVTFEYTSQLDELMTEHRFFGVTDVRVR